MKKIKQKTAKELAAMRDEDIDYSDIPELDERFFKRVELFRSRPKKSISLRLDPDIIEWFKGQGKGYQNYINAVLKSFVSEKKA